MSAVLVTVMRVLEARGGRGVSAVTGCPDARLPAGPAGNPDKRSGCKPLFPTLYQCIHAYALTRRTSHPNLLKLLCSLSSRSFSVPVTLSARGEECKTWRRRHLESSPDRLLTLGQHFEGRLQPCALDLVSSSLFLRVMPQAHPQLHRYEVTLACTHRIVSRSCS